MYMKWAIFFFYIFLQLYILVPTPPLHPFNKYNKITGTIYCFIYDTIISFFLLENPAVIYTTVDIIDLRCRQALLHV